MWPTNNHVQQQLKTTIVDSWEFTNEAVTIIIIIIIIIIILFVQRQYVLKDFSGAQLCSIWCKNLYTRKLARKSMVHAQERCASFRYKSLECASPVLGSRALRISANLWNSLPPNILQSQAFSSFRRHLKTHYCHSAYPAPQRKSQMRHDSLLRFWRYMNHLFSYLLIRKQVSDLDATPSNIPVLTKNKQTRVVWTPVLFVAQSSARTDSWKPIAAALLAQ